MKKNINGPVNVARLEGKINGVKKILYIFMDIHHDVSNQTQCDDIFSQDVHKFFVESFKDLNKKKEKYDFFLEILPSELADKSHNGFSDFFRRNYISEVIKIFRKIFIYDDDENKVSTNILFKNIRLHYIDLRDFYKNLIQNKIVRMLIIVKNLKKKI